ncbi:plasmid stablization protein ParB [Clostridium novyi A str. 4570]|uniref:Plasmid stablization protein ParB n=1 Tax=Clostridium novyi A str. 4570 TaxID=1444290 RepID=A0AA88ZLG4_CLONO|nr:ParB/RepB/Spo0J family partition protein [Clostridium novyi]KGN00164.1 plasmid stablization protein ParB [Clostridium novyi A str. 4570]
MSKKFGLGKGLGALIPEESNEDNNSILKIDMNLIKPNVDQPRKNFDESKIIQLADSIKEHGIIQPLVLQKRGNIYSIIAGERRWRAAKKAGLKEVPAVINELSDKQILEVSLIENIQREDLNPIEEAIAYKKLIDEFKLTQEELSKQIGKSRTAITNCMRLLNLDSRVQDYLIDGVITEGHGRALLSLEDKEIQYKMALEIIDKELSVRQTENTIKNLKKKNINKKEEEDDNIKPYYNAIENKLENLFNTKVVLRSKGNRGKIQIEYYSEEDLQRIIDILKI